MRGFLKAAALATGIWVLAVASASASTEFGNDCAADATEPGWTAIGMNSGERHALLPETAGPFEWSGGRAVITRWKVNLAPGLGPVTQQLVALRGGEKGVVNVGESAVETLVDGINEFKTRIPISEYARIGLRGPAETVFCSEREGNILGVVEGPFPLGQDREFDQSLIGSGGAGVAIAETDFDGDGYGDETQDGCPRAVEYHDACPYVQVVGWVEAIRPGALLIGVSTSIDTRVEVRGQSSWNDPYHRQGKRTVALTGGIQQLAANVPAVFRVPLPKAMIKKLRKMRPGERLKAQLLLARLDRLQDLPGTVTKFLAVRLPGRDRKTAKPAP